MVTRVKLNMKGFHDLRSAPGVKADLTRLANAVAQAATDSTERDVEFVVGSQQGASRPQGRWRATVVTGNAEAMAVNAKHNSLIKALDAARG